MRYFYLPFTRPSIRYIVGAISWNEEMESRTVEKWNAPFAQAAPVHRYCPGTLEVALILLYFILS